MNESINPQDKMPALENPVGSAAWIEKVKKTRQVTGERLVLDKKTGFMQLPNKLGFNAEKKKLFIELFAEGKAFHVICKATETPRNVVYSAIAIDPEFRKQYLELDEARTDDVEQMLRDNATNNRMASAERIFYLKKKRPQIYADKITIQHANPENEIIKGLLGKMQDYQLIPKEDVIDTTLIEGGQDEKSKG